MENKRPISDDEVVRTLCDQGLSIGDYFLSEDGKLPMFGSAASGWAALLIEDDELSSRCVEYLSRIGARRITIQEMKGPTTVRAL